MTKILNYINNEWVEPKVSEYADVINPATGEVLAKTPLCGQADVEVAAKAAAEAYPAWRATPTQDRIQYLFKSFKGAQLCCDSAAGIRVCTIRPNHAHRQPNEFACVGDLPGCRFYGVALRVLFQAPLDWPHGPTDHTAFTRATTRSAQLSDWA